MAKFSEIDLSTSDDVIETVDHNYYSKLKPTLFMLRYFGGPNGLYRRYSKRWRITKIITQLVAFLMLLALNGGTVMGCIVTIRTTLVQKTNFRQKLFVYVGLFVAITGVIGLNILWFRRKVFRNLLKTIDFEPKIGEPMDVYKKRKQNSRSRRRTIRLIIFMIIYSTYFGYTMSFSPDPQLAVFGFVYDLIFFLIIFIDMFIFGIILSLYITLSWIFRLKVRNVIKQLKNTYIIGAQNGQIPDPKTVRAFELWFKSYAVQLKKYDKIFKQFAGLVSVIMLVSVLWNSGDIAKQFLEGNLHRLDTSTYIDHVFIFITLFYTLSCVSAIENSLKSLIRLLYRLSLSLKFSYNSDEKQTNELSRKFKLLAETIDKSHLSLTIFGLIHINKGLIISTASLLTTFTLLIYEISNQRASDINNTTLINSTRSILNNTFF